MAIMGLQIEFAALLTTVQIQTIILFGIVAGFIIILGLGFIYRRDTRNFAANSCVVGRFIAGKKGCPMCGNNLK